MRPAAATPKRTPLDAASRRPRHQSIERSAHLMVAPVVILVAIFTLYPFAHAIYESMYLSSPFFPSRFVGLANYESVVTSAYFAGAVRVTLLFTLIAVPIAVILGVLVAVLLNERFIGNTVLRAGMLLPWALPASITGVIWKWMFLDSWGALNVVLYQIGLIDRYVAWLTSPRLAMMAVVIAFVWAQLPLAAALLLVAVQAVPGELYDAAALDGAGVFGRFWGVTFPSIRPMLVVVALYELLMAITTFDITYSLTHGGPGTATTMITYFTWAESFKMLNFGNGSALAIMVALGAILIILVLLRALPKDALLGDAR